MTAKEPQGSQILRDQFAALAFSKRAQQWAPFCRVCTRCGSKDRRTDGQGLGRAHMSLWRIKYRTLCSEKLGEVSLWYFGRTERGFVSWSRGSELP